MEKLILTCGRFVPAAAGTEARLTAAEDYLARLAEEMELLISEMGRALEELRQEREEG